MGFRNPVTSVSDVDTGPTPTGPGVRLYQDTVNNRGVLELRDGAPGHTPATLQLTNNPSAGDPHITLMQLQGVSSVVDSLAGEVAVAPRVNLDVVANLSSPGHYLGRLTLNSDLHYIEGQARVNHSVAGPDGDWTSMVPLLGAAWSAWDTAGNLPSYRMDAAGNVHVAGIVKLNVGSSLAAGGGVAVATLPAAYRPERIQHRISVIVNSSGVWQGFGWTYVDTAGVVFVFNSTAVTQPAGSGWALGLTFHAKEALV